MTSLLQLQKKLSKNLLSTKDQISLKGKGLGNMHRGGKCPPPVDEGKLKIKNKFK